MQVLTTKMARAGLDRRTTLQRIGYIQEVNRSVGFPSEILTGKKHLRLGIPFLEIASPGLVVVSYSPTFSPHPKSGEMTSSLGSILWGMSSHQAMNGLADLLRIDRWFSGFGSQSHHLHNSIIIFCGPDAVDL